MSRKSLRQFKRMIVRLWSKYRSIADCRCKCFWCVKPHLCDCGDFVSYAGLPYTAVDIQLKVSDDLVMEFNLDMFKRWRLYPILIVEGFPVRSLCYNVGVASDKWIEEYFGESDEDFKL